MNTSKKKVVITGAGGGMGLAIAKSFDESKYEVISVTHADGDFSDSKKVQEILGQHEADIFINSIGWADKPKDLEEITDEEYYSYIKNNIDPLFFALRTLLPHFKEKKEGLIINISSTAGLSAHPKFSAYSAAKFAVNALTEGTAKALENTNVKVINICPGPTNTKMRAEAFGEEDAKSQQSPEIIAKTIQDILNENLETKNGDQLVVRDGEVNFL